MKRTLTILCLSLASAPLAAQTAMPEMPNPTPARAYDQDPMVRLKQLIQIRGIRENSLVGSGLVVGLKGSGDGTPAARQSLTNFLQRTGRKVSSSELASGNIALVEVSAKLPPFPRHGTRLNVQVSSIGEASSLRGGRLILAELRGPDGKTYALAEGSVLIGGLSVKGKAASLDQNHPTVGWIPNGAICEPPVEELQSRLLNDSGELELLLPRLSNRTAVRAQEAIHDYLAERGIGLCKIGGTNLLRVILDPVHQEQDQLVRVLADIEDLRIRPDPPSKILVNERTGTIVIGKGVRLSPCILNISDLTIQVIEDELVSQPIAPGGIQRGTTERVPNTSIQVHRGQGDPKQIGGEGNLHDLISALRALGIDGHQMISVLQSLHQAGELHGELVVR